MGTREESLSGDVLGWVVRLLFELDEERGWRPARVKATAKMIFRQSRVKAARGLSGHEPALVTQTHPEPLETNRNSEADQITKVPATTAKSWLPVP
jgi:hypothetical protein